MKQKTATLSELQSFAPDFSALKAQLGKFNFFRSIRMQTMETRHSNVLAFLLDSKETHRLGNSFAQAFFSAVLAEVGNEIAIQMNQNDAQVRQTFLDGNFRVEREHSFIDNKNKERYIDLLLVAKDVVVCIENKTTSFQHDNQLEAYEKYVLDLKEHAQKKKIFLYLTPTKETVEGGHWIKISYKLVLQALDEPLRLQGLDPEVKIYLTHYQDIIRRDIMNNDQEIRKECMRLYLKDKEIYQTIFANTIGAAQGLLANVIVEKLDDLVSAGKIEILPQMGKKVCHTEFRFATKNLLNFIPYETTQSKERTWKSKSKIVYRILVSGTAPAPLSISFAAYLVTNGSAEDEKVTSKVINICNQHRLDFHLGKRPVERHKDNKGGFGYPTAIYNYKKTIAVPDELTDEFRIELHNCIDDFIKELKTLEDILEKELKN